MKQHETSHINLLILLMFMGLMFINTTHSTVRGEAKRSDHAMEKKKPHNHKHQKHRGSSSISNASASQRGVYPTQPNVFNVLSFGAHGDGHSDDSKAFLRAWKAACKAQNAILEVPAEFKFLVKPITFQGPCMPNLVLQIDGTVLAPPGVVGSWQESSLLQWLNFKWVNNFTIQGTGGFDGKGSGWWSLHKAQPLWQGRRLSKHIPDEKPTALRFYSSCNVTVRDIRVVNSPLCHLKFDGSRGIKISNVTISSPYDSPNTDGIHLQNSRDVEIEHSNIGCGDDCVSIQTGCSDIYIHHISCGPGHGISLGGLGKDRSVACVSNVNIENLSLVNTLYGVRIKTWQGGIGSVKNVSFSNIKVSDVKVPIVIDQYYCDKKFCKNQTDAVAISGVKFSRVLGTYAMQPIYLACSRSVPCTDIDLTDIRLKPSSGSNDFRPALCYNSYGKLVPPLLPSSIDDCLRSDSGWIKRIARSRENVCY